MNDVYILGGMRTPFVKSFTSYQGISTQALMEHSLKALVQKMGLGGFLVDDVALGALITSSTNWNLARECVLSSGLDRRTPAYNVQRACGTSLETAYQLYAKIKIGGMQVGIAGGVDTNSDAPIETNSELRKFIFGLNRAKNWQDKLSALQSASLLDLGFSSPGVTEPRTGLSMGEHCEQMVQSWNVSQKEQDEIALRSHQNGIKAYESGFYNDLVSPFEDVTRDGFLRADTSLAKLCQLRPAFDKVKGTITAGNASPLSDGSSAVLLASLEGAQRLGHSPQARFIDFQTAAVNFVAGDGLLMAPTMAVAKLLHRNRMSLQDFDYYEIHEAFAGQVICTLKAWDSDTYCREALGLQGKLGEIDLSRMNVTGGSIALGHPFAATGGRIIASLSKLLKGSKKRGLISICTAGGMGIAAILEGV